MGRRITDFYINYNRELHFGDAVELARVMRQDGSYIVEGHSGDAQNFICRMDFD